MDFFNTWSLASQNNYILDFLKFSSKLSLRFIFGNFFVKVSDDQMMFKFHRAVITEASQQRVSVSPESWNQIEGR